MNRRRRLPRSGTSNQKTATVVTSTKSPIAMIPNGTVFPTMSSPAVSGLTLSCSSVPISRSRTMASEVSSRQTSMMRVPTTPGTL